jgi:putative transposase
MPRPLRQIQTNVIYHVLNRSNRRMMIFNKPADFRAFVETVNQALDRFDVDLLAWCLMGNHWHLVLRPRRAGQLQAFMQWISITHVRRHLARRGRSSGHLYRGRYKHFPVQADAHLHTLLRYVEANALRAGLVRWAENWRWSSLYQRLHRRTAPKLSDWPVDRPRDWTRLVNQALPEAELIRVRRSIERDRPLGSDSWMKKIAARLGLGQKLKPIGRPRKPMEKLSARQKRRREKEKSGQNGA